MEKKKKRKGEKERGEAGGIWKMADNHIMIRFTQLWFTANLIQRQHHFKEDKQ